MHTTPLVLTAEQRRRLEALLRRSTAPQRLVERALIVLAASDGRPLRAIARDLALRPTTVRKWCRRFELRGIEGLQDSARSGRPRGISATDRCLVIATACQDPAEHGLAGHSNWSANLLAQVLSLSGQVAKISSRSVQRILQVAAIKPHRCAYWKQPIDPLFEAKMRPVIDLYLTPPADGPVVCADEKTCIQALRRRFPDRLPSRPGQLRLRSVEYVRQGTRCLTAGLFVHTGKILGLVTPTRPMPTPTAGHTPASLWPPEVGHEFTPSSTSLRTREPTFVKPRLRGMTSVSGRVTVRQTGRQVRHGRAG